MNLTQGDAPNIDFGLAPGKMLSGKMTAAGAGLAGQELGLFSAAGKQLPLKATTWSDGGYTFFAGLPLGKYKVRTANSLGYIYEWFDNPPVFANPFAAACVRYPKS